MTTNQRLSLFVSSRMKELAEERKALQDIFERSVLFKCSISWLWEIDAGASSDTIRSFHLKEVEDCDIYIGLFWRGYGQYAIDECRHARVLKKPCLIYQKNVDIQRRDPRLTVFLNEINQIKNQDDLAIWPFTGHETPIQIAEKVQDDVIRLLVTTFHDTRLQPATSFSPSQSASSTTVTASKESISTHSNDDGTINQNNLSSDSNQYNFSSDSINIYVFGNNKIDGFNKTKDTTNTIRQQSIFHAILNDEPQKILQETQVVFQKEPLENLQLDYQKSVQDTIHNSVSSFTEHMLREFTLLSSQLQMDALPNISWHPFEIPNSSHLFVGRQRELDMLVSYLAAGKNVIITGEKRVTSSMSGGIGKTSLALQLVKKLNNIFPKSILWIELGPHIKNAQDTQIPLRKLAECVFDSQLIGQIKPKEVAGWLKEVVSEPVLVVLDDLCYREPLDSLIQALPDGTTLLVTTRYLDAVQALDGHLFTLGNLEADGILFLEENIKFSSNTTYQPFLQEIVKLLNGHALSLEIIASRIKKLSRTHFQSHLQMVINHLRQDIGQENVVDLRLSSGERDRNFEKAFAFSYDKMNEEQKRCFRSLGVFPTISNITVEAAAYVWKINDLFVADSILSELADLALIIENEDSTGSYYRQHSILNTYAHAMLDRTGELLNVSKRHATYCREIILKKNLIEIDEHIHNLLLALHWSSEFEPTIFVELLESTLQYLISRGQGDLLDEYLPKAVTMAASTKDIKRQAKLLLNQAAREYHKGNFTFASRLYIKSQKLQGDDEPE